jgi:uncharacterized SAM-binding protein YcdF (DUF218 family)
MFFYPSKLLWFVAQPTNALTLVVLLSAILLFTRLARPARWLALMAGLGLLTAGMSPLPYWLLRPLEDRFPKVEMTGDVAGIIVLGGAIGTTRGMTSLNDAGARMTDSTALALKFPKAKLVFSGGDATLVEELDATEAKTEAEAARRFYVSLGIDERRLILEDKSRNTRENAILTKALINQKPGERWLLITSAWHMPRSVGIFRQAGIDVVPYPVDYATRGIARDYRQLNRGFSYGLSLTDLAVKEWVGLLVYRLAGYTDSLLPGP